MRAALPPAAYARRRGAGGGRRKGSSRTPTPTAGGRRPVRRVIYRESIPRLGGNVVRPAWTVRRDVEDAVPYRAGARRAFVRKTQNFLAGVELLPRPAWDFAGCGVY